MNYPMEWIKQINEITQFNELRNAKKYPMQLI